MKWQSRDNAHKSRRHSAFGSQLARQERGANRGRADVEDCAWDRSNSEQGMGAERRACGLPRERRTGAVEVVMTTEDGSGRVVVVVRESVTQFGPQRLQGKWCRKKAVSWCRAGPTFED